MELVTTKAILHRALSAAAAVAPEKASPAILSHALLVCDAKGRVTLTAQQVAPLTYGTSFSAEVKRSGKACIPVRHVAGVVKALPEGDVTMSLAKNGTLTVSSGKRKVTGIGTQDPEEYPSVNSARSAPVKIPVGALRQLVKRVFHAASENDGQAHLCSLYVLAREGGLTAVCTNGGTLAKTEVSVEGLKPWAAFGGSALFPRVTIETILRKLPDALPVMLAVDANHLATLTWDSEHGSHETYTTQLLDAAFPSWQEGFRIFAAEVRGHTTVAREPAAEAVRFACLTRDAVALVAKSTSLGVQSTDDDKGQSSEDLDAMMVTVGDKPPAALVATKGPQLASALDAFDGDTVCIGIGGDESPVVVTDATEPGTIICIAALRA